MRARRLFGPDRLNPLILWAFLALTLAMRAVVPSGYMVAPNQLSFTMELCDSSLSGQTRSVEVTIPLESGDPHDSQAQEHCAFTSLAHAATADTTPAPLAPPKPTTTPAAKLGHAFHLPPAPRLRPPLRAPPFA